MKRSGNHRYTYAKGFTLLEVMIAIGILGISLVAIFNVQGSSIAIASRVKSMTAATLLARSKMIDIEHELMEEGFSDFAEEMEGNFEEEGWPNFRWHATVSKVKIPVPSSMPGQDSNQYASMMSGYSSMITDLIGNALREVILTVEWGRGQPNEQLVIATHFIELGRAAMLETTPGGIGDNLNDAATKSDGTTATTEQTSQDDAKTRFNRAHDKIKNVPGMENLFKTKK